MSPKGEYIDVTNQTYDGYIDVTKSSNKHESIQMMTSREYIDAIKAEFRENKSIDQHPKRVEKAPEIVYSTGEDPNTSPQAIAQEATEDIRLLDVGDPNESISVPMILTTENRSFKNLIRGKQEVSQQVIIRKMTRDHYRKYYAKDVEGNYIGTEKPAVDAGLVLVPSKSTPEEILRQVREVAFGREHHINDFGGAWAYGGGGQC